MSVPTDPVSPCAVVESELSACEARLAAMGNAVIPVWTTSPASVTSSLDSGSADVAEPPVILIGCYLMLGILTLLHVARQAWYAWGGEGAYAFPYDK
jgi:hypothetical protein